MQQCAGEQDGRYEYDISWNHDEGCTYIEADSYSVWSYTGFPGMCEQEGEVITHMIGGYENHDGKGVKHSKHILDTGLRDGGGESYNARFVWYYQVEVTFTCLKE